MIDVPGDVLPTFLTEGPEAANRQIHEQQIAELERLQREAPEAYQKLEEDARRKAEYEPLRKILQDFIQAEMWAESQEIVEKNPELLSERTDAILMRLINPKYVRFVLMPLYYPFFGFAQGASDENKNRVKISVFCNFPILKSAAHTNPWGLYVTAVV